MRSSARIRRALLKPRRKYVRYPRRRKESKVKLK